MEIYEEKDLIYHYCSIETFYEIITNQTFRFSNTKRMNDKTDSKWFNHLLKHHLECSKEEGHSFWHVFEDIGEALFYACCFSKNGNDLGQWKAYTNNGTGVAIGIIRPKHGLGYLKTLELIYEKNEQHKLLNMFIDTIKNKTSSNLDHDKVWNDRFSLAAKLKHSGFESEKEVRILYSPWNDDSIKGLGQYTSVLYPDFIVKNNNIIDYFDVPFNKIIHMHNDHTKLFLIQKIYLGPQCLLEEKQLTWFLQKYFPPEQVAQIIIEKSDIPYENNII